MECCNPEPVGAARRAASKFNGYKGEKREHLSYSRFMNRVMISEFTISVKNPPQMGIIR